MKKTAALLLAILMLLLTACGQTAQPAQPTAPNQPAPVTEDNPPDPAEPAAPAVPASPADALSLFAASDLWKTAADYANDRVALTITDLDRNGRQELILSQIGGTGSYSYTRFFEVSETGDGVTECTFAVPEGTSQPDLLLQDTAECWYDKEMNEYIYIFKDFLKISAAEYQESIRGICLKNGTVTEMTLAVKNTAGETVTYTDEFGNPFSGEIFEIAAEMAFWGFERSELKLNWKDLSAFDGLTGAELAAKLAEAVS